MACAVTAWTTRVFGGGCKKKKWEGEGTGGWTYTTLRPLSKNIMLFGPSGVAIHVGEVCHPVLAGSRIASVIGNAIVAGPRFLDFFQWKLEFP